MNVCLFVRYRQKKLLDRFTRGFPQNGPRYTEKVQSYWPSSIRPVESADLASNLCWIEHFFNRGINDKINK